MSVPLDPLSWDQTLEIVSQWAAQDQGRMVCLCNSHSLVSAQRDPGFRHVLARADLRLPDGAPVAWRLRQMGHPRQARISGPDLMERYLALAAQRQEPLYLYGATEATLARLRERLQARWPQLRIAGSCSPPFREQTPQEEADAAARIRDSGARTVWVALGCPRQERWMARMRARIPAVLLGVGAAFDFLSGTVRRAPPWMQRAGLEWLHRAGQEPMRLGSRYLVTQPLFVAGVLHEMLRSHRPERRQR